MIKISICLSDLPKEKITTAVNGTRHNRAATGGNKAIATESRLYRRGLTEHVDIYGYADSKGVRYECRYSQLQAPTARRAVLPIGAVDVDGEVSGQRVYRYAYSKVC